MQISPFSTRGALTSEGVVWLYRCFLMRDPESEEAIEWFRETLKTFDKARSYLLKCDEFELLSPDVVAKPQYYIPEAHAQPYFKSSQRVCLASIVKNEALRVENMIRSCAPLIDYAVFVDTGSEDQTISIIEATTSSLNVPLKTDTIIFEDFSQARNAALDLVPNDVDWILMLDADEELVPADYCRFNALLASEDVDAWQLPRYDFSDFAKRMPVVPYPDYQLRLFRNRPKNPVRFSGRVHERPHNVQWRDAPASKCEVGVIGGPHIHHLGFMGITHERWRKKHEFYTALSAVDSAQAI